MTDLERKNRKVAEALGLCWHEEDSGYALAPCKHCGKVFEINPNFITDPLSLLRLMREGEDWMQFVAYLSGRVGHKDNILFGYFILDTTGKLLESVWEWKEKQNN